MKQLILCLAGVSLFFTSCSEETIVQEQPVSSKQSIELLTFGFAEYQTEQNKGFGANFYCYIDLTTDSVFIQRKINPLEENKISAWAGILPGISQQPVIVEYIEASQKYVSGTTISPELSEGTLYCGNHYYIKYKQDDEERFHFYRTTGLDEKYKQVTDYIQLLEQNSILRQSHKFINEDSVVVPAVNQPGFSLRQIPPPIRAKVNYAPPVEKR